MFIIYQKDQESPDWNTEWKSGEMLSARHFLVHKGKKREKFYKDQCFIQDEKQIIVFDGVLLNSSDLFSKYKVETVVELIRVLFERDRDFFKEFRGNFNGCVYDLNQNTLLIFADHLSNKPIFYYEDSDCFIAGASVWEIVDFCKKHNKLKLDRGGCYSLITYAYMYHDVTLFEGIKRLLPGWYLTVENDVVKKHQFYEITRKNCIDISMEEAIDKIDELFLKAIKTQVEKNKEYGYDNYAPLSAGLDSRITTMALNRLGADNIINFTYSETNQLDQRLPMKIAKDLGNVWLFKSLDNGLDLFDIDTALEIGDSLLYYAWPSQLENFMKLVNSEKMGVIHTGVIGDVVVGTFIGKDGGRKGSYNIGDGAYSKKLVDKLKENIKESHYESYEIGMMYNRAINGAAMGYSTTFKKYAEACSPFMDIDLLDFCFSLPIAYQLQHRIYYKWVEKCYPQAMRYSHNGLKISTSNIGFRVKGKFIKLNTIPSRIRIILKNRIDRESGMNPIDYWYTNNMNLARYMDDYFSRCTKLKELDDELYRDAKWLYESGNAIEKIMAISLVGSVERI